MNFTLNLNRQHTLLIAAAGMMLASPAAIAQQTVVTYTLDNVWLLPDISHPFTTERQMTATFEWSYDEGDFENGVGTLLAASIPWFSLGLEDIGFNADGGSLEFTLIGNYHDLGLDVSLFLPDPLSPDLPSPIDTVRSAFDVQNGISYQGHVISGSLVQVAPPCIVDMNGDGIVDNGDIMIFINLFLAFDLAADLTGDGLLDSGDIIAFVGMFLAGC